MSHEIDVIDHQPDPIGPLKETDTILANGSAESLQPYIDIETFPAIPEHGGSMKEMIQIYKDNPNAPLPQCVKNLGITSSEQLIQRAEGRDDPTKRAPTIREKREAKERQSEKQLKTTDSVEKPVTPNISKAVSLTKTERHTVKKMDELISQTKSVEPALAQEQATRTALDAIEAPDKPTVVATDINKRRVEPILESTPDIVVTEAENVLRRQTLELANKSRLEIDQLDNQEPRLSGIVTEPTITWAPTIERQVDRISDLAEQGVDPEVIDYTSSSLETSVEDTYMSLLSEAGVEGKIAFDIEELTAELKLEYFVPEIGDAMEGMELVAEDGPKQTDIEENVLTTESLIDGVGLDLAPDVAVYLRDPNGESINPILAKELLQSLVEDLKLNQTATDKGEEISEVEIKRIEHLFFELLESENLDYQDEAVTQLIQELLSPEMITGITEDHELSIDRLNYLGTREYMPSSISALFISIVQMIKQKIEPHLRLGKYALTASMA